MGGLNSMTIVKSINNDDHSPRFRSLKTNHGILSTPFFMPDATRSFIKTLSIDDLKKTKTESIVVNTFHLYLQPGIDVLKKAGGVHKFMDWDLPIVSDSGGFQIFSLIHGSQSRMGKVDDDKASFKSPIDGSWHEISPEKSIQIQFDLGVDIIICLDECPPNDWSREDLGVAVKRSINWAKRCKQEYLRQLHMRGLNNNNRPLITAVIQGGEDEALRKYCAQELVKISFDIYGFGASPVDTQGNFMAETLFKTASFIPSNAYRFALGIGNPEDIYRSFLMGWDIFDCVIPTREGRHGRLFYFNSDFHGFSGQARESRAIIDFPDFYKTINIANSRFRDDFSPINAKSGFSELRNYTKAYLYHLFKSKESLGQKLASLNNLEFYQNLILELKKINK